MKHFYDKCVEIYDDYRAVVPSYAAAALRLFIIIIVPAFSLVAVGTSLLNIDMSLIENIIQQIVMPEYSAMIIDV